jgi:nitroimidazol reductase NimA-like FMN-containing flavoprotein (pyridoxamine 5'-phosphate oxidase superfamily)
MDKSLDKAILNILTQSNDMSLATMRPDGFPQATTVSYVSDGMTIYFATGTHAQKAQNLAQCDKISLTVDRPYSNWNEILGLSLGGTAARVTDETEIEHAKRLMMKKFPQAADFAMPEEAIALFRITPTVISVLDYSKGFGHTDTVTL